MTQANPQAKGDLDAALLEAVKLLKQDPAKAAVAAQDILTQFPENTSASQILGAANRLMGQPELALDILEPVAARVSNNAKLLHELGLCYSALGQDAKSLKSLRDAVQTDPKLSAAWLSLGNQLALKGDNQGSTKAFQQHLATSTQHPQLVTAAEHLQAGKLGLAEPLVRKVLKEHPTDVSAMRLLADIGIQVSRYEDAKNLLERALELAPDFTLAPKQLRGCVVSAPGAHRSTGAGRPITEGRPQQPPLLDSKRFSTGTHGHPPACPVNLRENT
jgi:tetratricopeptide (TPR) repeat protein